MIEPDNNANVANIRAFHQDQKYNRKVSNLPVRDQIRRLNYSKEQMLESPREEEAYDTDGILFNGEIIYHKNPNYADSVHFKFTQNIEEEFLDKVEQLKLGVSEACPF